MKKIIWLITNLNIGGAEKVLIDITNKLSSEYDMTILTIYSRGELEKELRSNIKIKSLFKKAYNDYNPLTQKLIGLICKFRPLSNLFFKRKIKDIYDTYIAFLEGPPTYLLSNLNITKNKIAFIHTDITKHYINKKKLINMTYKSFEKIVFVTKDIRDKFNNEYKVNSKLEVIHNYIDIQRIEKKALEKINIPYEKGKINFLVVARIVKPKGLDRLLTVHEKLIKSGFTHNIYIIGDGEEKEPLEKQIKNLNMEKTFVLLGKMDNPYPYMKASDCFIQPSYYEGYGVALVEAAILNKYIITTDTASKEAIADYNNKIICENSEDGLYDALKEMIQNNKTTQNSLEYTIKYDKIIKEIKEIL